jgi:hypothetical protein
LKLPFAPLLCIERRREEGELRGGESREIRQLVDEQSGFSSSSAYWAAAAKSRRHMVKRSTIGIFFESVGISK